MGSLLDRYPLRSNIDADSASPAELWRYYIQLVEIEEAFRNLNRYTQPNRDQKLLLSQLKLTLPPQSPPKIYAKKEKPSA